MIDITRIAMWSGPRNISTAMMRSFENRKDTVVIDEPFYAYYLNKTGFDHPCRKEVLRSQSKDWNEVVGLITSDLPKNKSIWYQKHMAHHILDLNNIEWINNCHNAILLRHPKEVISSYSKKNKLNSVDELGYPQQYEIIKYLKKINRSYIIIDSNELLKNPEKVLSTWCMKINLKFDNASSIKF